jgi:hypothetical protein
MNVFMNVDEKRKEVERRIKTALPSFVLMSPKMNEVYERLTGTSEEVLDDVLKNWETIQDELVQHYKKFTQ